MNKRDSPGLLVQPAEILAQDAEHEELDAPEEGDRGHDARPPGHSGSTIEKSAQPSIPMAKSPETSPTMLATASGLTKKDVTASMAKRTILSSVYLVEPAKRGARS